MNCPYAGAVNRHVAFAEDEQQPANARDPITPPISTRVGMYTAGARIKGSACPATRMASLVANTPTIASTPATTTAVRLAPPHATGRMGRRIRDQRRPVERSGVLRSTAARFPLSLPVYRRSSR